LPETPSELHLGSKNKRGTGKWSSTRTIVLILQVYALHLLEKKQIVIEANNGKRVLLDICDPRASDLSISEALQEGIHAPNVLAGVLTALHARNIAVDFAS
jgi:hypothetical protein